MMVDCPAVQICVRWREVAGAPLMTEVPRGAPADYPLYIRFIASGGWGVYHAASHLRIRTLHSHAAAVHYLFAIANMTDWAQPAAQLDADRTLVRRLADLAQGVTA